MRWLGAAAAVIAVVAAGAWALTRPAQRTVGGNQIGPGEFVASLKPHSVICDDLGDSANPSDYAVVTLAFEGAPSGAVRITYPGARPATVRGLHGGVTRLPLRTPAHAGGPTACLRNVGTGRMLVAGLKTGAPAAIIDGKHLPLHVSYRVGAYRPSTWWTRRRAVVHRIGHAVGAPAGALTGWVALLLFVGATGLTAATIARWAR